MERNRFILVFAVMGIVAALLLGILRQRGWVGEDITALLWPAYFLLFRPEGTRLSPMMEGFIYALAVALNSLLYSLIGIVLSLVIQRKGNSSPNLTK